MATTARCFRQPKPGLRRRIALDGNTYLLVSASVEREGGSTSIAPVLRRVQLATPQPDRIAVKRPVTRFHD